MYLDGDRAPIATAAAVLSKADVDDEETIDRSWVLLCLSKADDDDEETEHPVFLTFSCYIHSFTRLPTRLVVFCCNAL